MNIYFVLSIVFSVLSVLVGCGILSEIFAGIKKLVTGIKECMDEIEKGEDE